MSCVLVHGMDRLGYSLVMVQGDFESKGDIPSSPYGHGLWHVSHDTVYAMFPCVMCAYTGIGSCWVFSNGARGF